MSLTSDPKDPRLTHGPVTAAAATAINATKGLS